MLTNIETVTPSNYMHVVQAGGGLFLGLLLITGAASAAARPPSPAEAAGTHPAAPPGGLLTYASPSVKGDSATVHATLAGLSCTAALTRTASGTASSWLVNRLDCGNGGVGDAAAATADARSTERGFSRDRSRD